jgi:anhydro-N-acetylmuramic acid kinase
VLRDALGAAGRLSDRTVRQGPLGAAEEVVTEAHGEAVERLLAENPDVVPALVGFHGQTVFHAPERRLTVQIGDGPGLARRLGVPVVHDFRAADVAAGGEGAPFVPVYHQALVARSGLTGTVAVVNIGGVANFTRVAADGTISAGDTGPGNALLDDFIRERTGAAMDANGETAAKGRVDVKALEAMLASPWFGLPFPKSLDRNAFSREPVAGLATEDGAATLVAFTARTIALGLRMAGGAERVVIVGGGSRNPTLVGAVAEATGVPTGTAAELGWAGDFIEAEAFAYLAARSVAGLPLSYPSTTGVPQPMPGGVLARP